MFWYFSLPCSYVDGIRLESSSKTTMEVFMDDRLVIQSDTIKGGAVVERGCKVACRYVAPVGRLKQLEKRAL